MKLSDFIPRKLNDIMNVETATLHGPITIPGLMTTSTTLNKTKVNGATFTYTPQGLLIEKDNKAWVIPHSAVAAYHLTPIEEKQAKK